MSTQAGKRPRPGEPQPAAPRDDAVAKAVQVLMRRAAAVAAEIDALERQRAELVEDQLRLAELAKEQRPGT
jgi:hypothetical protein